jgi:excisionase family DNA binding protein
VNAEEARLLLDARQVAEALGVGRATFYRKLAAGCLPRPVRIGGMPRWRRTEIQAWVEAVCPPRSRWAWPEEKKRPG